MTQERKTAVSLDLDGVLFPRPIPIQGGALLAYIQPWSYNKPFVPKHAPITASDREPQIHLLSEWERNEVKRHLNRLVKPEVAEMVRQMQVDAIFGNTGRPNNLYMIQLTKSRLRKAKISNLFQDIFFKPENVSSDESKYWALRQLLEMGFADIIHYDDNALTVKRLAGALPQVRFVIVQDLTSGILFSRKEMERYPNVARIAIRKNGHVDVVHESVGFGGIPHGPFRLY